MADVKIFVFVNRTDRDGCVVEALCECGRFVAAHYCSSPGYAQHDMGFTSNWKHDSYKQHLAEEHAGAEKWQLEWVPESEVKAHSHTGLNQAYATHQRRFQESDHGAETAEG